MVSGVIKRFINYYNFRCHIIGTENRSVSQTWLEIILRYVIKRWTMDNALSLRLIYRYDRTRYCLHRQCSECWDDTGSW